MDINTSTATRFWAKVDIGSPEACWLWTAATQRGYGAFRLTGKDGTRRQVNAHRVAYAIANGSLDPKEHVMHSCDVTLCCNPSHLSTGDRKANMRDAAAKGRMGGKYRKPRVPDADREVIRQRHGEGKAIRAIAREFGVAPMTVRNIIREVRERPRESADTHSVAGELGVHLVASLSPPER